MPRLLRFLPAPGALVEVTTRTIQSRHLLRPTAPINQAVLGVLGRAQRMYGMVVHFAVVLSNHYHLLLAPNDAEQLADFMTFVNSNIAREVGRLVDWKARFWGRRYQAIVVSDEPLAELARLEYFLANSVKEHLVESPLEWPGVHAARALLGNRRLEGIWFDRSAFCRAKRRRKVGTPPARENDHKSVEALQLTILPCLSNLDEREQRDHVENLIQKVTQAAAAVRKALGSMVVGAARLQKQHPHSRPNQIKNSPAPRFHTYAITAQKRLRDAYSAFEAAFRTAAGKLRSGAWEVRFPEGCFPPALPFCS